MAWPKGKPRPKFKDDGTPIQFGRRKKGDSSPAKAPVVSKPSKTPRIPSTTGQVAMDAEFKGSLFKIAASAGALRESLASVQSSLRTLYKDARKAGIEKSDIDLVLKLRGEQAADIAAAAARRARIIEWVYPGSSAAPIEAPAAVQKSYQDTLKDIYRQGFEAGEGSSIGANGNPPYRQHTPEYEAWLSGWNDGRVKKSARSIETLTDGFDDPLANFG